MPLPVDQLRVQFHHKVFQWHPKHLLVNRLQLLHYRNFLNLINVLKRIKLFLSYLLSQNVERTYWLHRFKHFVGHHENLVFFKILYKFLLLNFLILTHSSNIIVVLFDFVVTNLIIKSLVLVLYV